MVQQLNFKEACAQWARLRDEGRIPKLNLDRLTELVDRVPEKLFVKNPFSPADLANKDLQLLGITNEFQSLMAAALAGDWNRVSIIQHELLQS